MTRRARRIVKFATFSRCLGSIPVWMVLVHKGPDLLHEVHQFADVFTRRISMPKLKEGVDSQNEG